MMKSPAHSATLYPALIALVLFLLQPAPAAAGRRQAWNFSRVSPEEFTAQFEHAYYGPYLRYGVPLGTWTIRGAGNRRALFGSLTDAQELPAGAASHSFALVRGFECLDGSFQARFNVVEGQREPGAGIVWRYQDPRNYMLLRLNHLEKNLVLYRTIDGTMTELCSVDLGDSCGAGRWHTIGAGVRGTTTEVYFEGKKAGEARDATIPRKGRAGLWIRGKTMVYYRDYTLENSGGKNPEPGNLPPGTAPWSITTVDSSKGSGHYCSLAFDRKGHPGIAHYDMQKKNAKYAVRTQLGWVVETIDRRVDTGCFARLAYNRLNEPNIAYSVDSYGPSRDRPYSGPHFAYKRREAWNTVYAFNRGSIWYVSLALDTDDYPHLAYLDRAGGSIQYSQWTGSRWNNETIATLEKINYDRALGVSMAISSRNRPMVVYHDPSTGLICATRKTKGSWALETIDREGSPLPAGLYCSLALDRRDQPHVSYYMPNQRCLRYARKKSHRRWETMTIDRGEDTGQYSSIAVGRSGDPHIAYYNGTDGFIRYACRKGRKWTIVRTSCQGYYPSLKLNQNDTPHIAFYDMIMDCLRMGHPRGN